MKLTFDFTKCRSWSCIFISNVCVSGWRVENATSRLHTPASTSASRRGETRCVMSVRDACSINDISRVNHAYERQWNLMTLTRPRAVYHRRIERQKAPREPASAASARKTIVPSVGHGASSIIKIVGTSIDGDGKGEAEFYGEVCIFAIKSKHITKFY